MFSPVRHPQRAVVSWSGVKNMITGPATLWDETNRHKNLERVEYHWVIVGEAVTDKKTVKNSSVASVTMHDLNGAKMPDDPETWPGDTLFAW